MDRLKTWRMSSTIERYYCDIKKLNRLYNGRLMYQGEGFTNEEVNRISLYVFKEHLPEPTKTMIFTINLDTLDKAFKII